MSTTTVIDDNIRTETEEVTKTIICPLETSHRKNDRIQTCIDEWQEAASTASDYLPTIPEYRWGDVQATWISRLRQKTVPTDELTTYANTIDEAFDKVSEAFGSWKERGCPGNRPSFGHENYLRIPGKYIEVAENNRGHGLKFKLEPYTDPEWFHVAGGPYQDEHLSEVVDGDLDHGSAELHLDPDTGNLTAHVTVTREIEVYRANDVEHVVGVDLGENVLYATAVVGPVMDTPDVELESGREFRHHREELSRRKDRFQERGDLARVKQLRGERRRYTDQMTDVASRRIVDIALDHLPCAIILEDLTDYRETANDPIHDWPFAEIQEKITYKATEKGIPVETVDPRFTSQTCRKCGNTEEDNRTRDRVEFICQSCGYEVHGDVNAAIRIGQKWFE